MMKRMFRLRIDISVELKSSKINCFGVIIATSFVIVHPHPNPPPSRGRELIRDLENTKIPFMSPYYRIGGH
jgi:hypothetical protein